ncbi:MAG: HIT domain-containing protein [Alphaproteobacteria bacterium]
MSFTLHTQLEADSLPICALPLCDIRLINDSRYPWVLAVPRLEDASDWQDLADDDAAQLHTEVMKVARALKAIIQPRKMNIASLGNMVPQLHVHIVARFEEDAAWPGPIWGVGQAVPYTAPPPLISALQERLMP